MKTIPLGAAVDCSALIGECTELGDDPEAWQGHLTDGAERLIGGCSTAFKILRVEPGGPVFDEALLSPRSDARMRAQFSQCLSEGGHRDIPSLATLMPFAFRTGGVAFRYSDLGGGLRAFHDSSFYNRYLRCLGVGDVLTANTVQPTGHVVSIWILRERTERAFSCAEESTLAFMSAVLSRLIGARLATRSQAARPKLAPRVRQTLEALLEGDSEKQIALRLGLQRTTVHDYVRKLYRDYGVHSRGELMACFVKRRARRDGASE